MSSRRRCCQVLAMVLAVLSTPGCLSHHHLVGLGPTGLGQESSRQFYMLFGLVRMNEVDPQRMAGDLTSYTVDSEFSFLDLLLAPILLPFSFTSRTVTVTT